MNRSDDESPQASVMNVSTVRRHVRRRMIKAKREVLRLVRLADRGDLSAEDSADRGPSPER